MLRKGKLVGVSLVSVLLRIDLVKILNAKEHTALDHLEQRARSVVVDESDASIFVNAEGLGRRGAINPAVSRMSLNSWRSSARSIASGLVPRCAPSSS